MHWYHVVVALWVCILFVLQAYSVWVIEWTPHGKVLGGVFVVGLTLTVIGALHVGGFW